MLKTQHKKIKKKKKKNRDHGIQLYDFMTNRRGKIGSTDRFYFLGFKITEDGDCSHKIKRCLLLVRKAMTNLDSTVKKQRHHFADKGPYSQSYVFFSSHTQM